MKNEIVIRVRLNREQFIRFCNFDTFKRQRRWFLPVMASMILMTASVFLLLFVPQDTSIFAGITTGLAIAVPMIWFGLYFIQLQVQAVQMNLKENPEVYSLWLRNEHVRVVSAAKPESPVDLYWNQFFAAYRRKDCIYLYVNPQRAFILPSGQSSASDEELWRFISGNMPEGRCFSVSREGSR